MTFGLSALTRKPFSSGVDNCHFRKQSKSGPHHCDSVLPLLGYQTRTDRVCAWAVFTPLSVATSMVLREGAEGQCGM